jgi:hypothetical protein
MKIGHEHSALGLSEGIHWHMNISNKIEYIYTDELRDTIPWVKLINDKGEEIIYKSTEVSFDENNYPKENLRIMDCIDCHNRPSHIFNPADKSVNLSMSLQKIDESLPYIKSVSVEALEKHYTTKELGLNKIRIFIDEFYKYNYPEIYRLKKSSIEKSTIETQKIYTRNYFPKMNASWRAFPNHISHLYDTGCFRCHDNKHVSDDGQVIRKDCNLCHTIISQVAPDGEEHLSIKGLDFIHPIELEEPLIEQVCVDCHAREKQIKHDRNTKQISQSN